MTSATQNADVLESNFVALREKYPEYADTLSAIPESAHYAFEDLGNSFTCRDLHGTWVHGPDDPWEAARSEAARIVSDEPQLYILFRPAMGYLALAVIEALASRRSGSLVLVVEDRLELIKAALARVDWKPLVYSGFSVVLFGDPFVTVEAFLRRHAMASLLPMNVVFPPEMENDPAVQSLADRLVAFSKRTQELAEAELGNVGGFIRERRARREPSRLLIDVPAMGYLAIPLADGFRAAGCGVELAVETNSAPRGFRAHDWVSKIADVAPDVVLWMDRPELSGLASSALRDLGIVNVHWSLDSPRRMRLTADDLELVDLHLCFDAHYLSKTMRRTALQSSQLSLAAGLVPLPGCGPSDAPWPRRLGPDLTFVGSLGESRVTRLREVLRQLEPELLAWLEDVAATTEDPADAFEKKTGRPYEGAPCLYVDEVRSARRRIDVLSALPKAALKIFGGTEWARAGGPIASCYAGRSVPYGFDLSSLYFHSRINVNVFHEQCVDSTNSRVYDVLAAGGFLLTEYRPQLEKEFDIGRHLAVFRTAAEARDKAMYYLGHPKEREAIAREGQSHVLAEHTFAHRARKVMELVRSSGQGL